MTTRLFPLLLLVSLIVPTNLSATDSLSVDKPNVIGRLRQTAERLARKRVDTTYIALPLHPWRVKVKTRVMQTTQRFKSHVDVAEAFGEGHTGELLWETRMRPPVTFSSGVWVGYRGLGLGFQRNMGNSKSTNLNLEIGTLPFSATIHWLTDETDRSDIRVTGWLDGTSINRHETSRLTSPVKTKALVLDAYYFFNHRRFSHAAAYKQSLIQRRSSGSLMLGLLAYYTEADYASAENAEMLRMMGGVGRLKVWQGSLGVGYSYNDVPSPGWLINAHLMPMLTLVNSGKRHLYALPAEGGELEPLGTEHFNMGIDYNLDGRLSVTRSWQRFFVSLYGQLHHFYYRHRRTSGQTFDWQANLSLGLRF